MWEEVRGVEGADLEGWRSGCGGLGRRPKRGGLAFCPAPRPQGLVQAWAAWDALLPLEVLLFEHPELYTPGHYRMASEPKEVISITSIDPFIENKHHHAFP